MHPDTSYTVDQAAQPVRELTLPSGQTLQLCRVRNKHRLAVLEQYARFLEPIAIMMDAPPSIEDARELLPEVLREVAQTPFEVSEEHAAELGEEDAFTLRHIGLLRVTEFLNVFMVTPLQPEQVASFEIDDFTALWGAIWEIARYPFAGGHTDAIKSGRLQQAILDWRSSMNRPSLPASTASGSTPETPTSNTNTASPSPPRKPDGKTSKRRK